MQIIKSSTVRKANRALAKARLKPFQNMGLPKPLVKEIYEEFQNCFAQGVLFERHGTNWQAQK